MLTVSHACRHVHQTPGSCASGCLARGRSPGSCKWSKCRGHGCLPLTDLTLSLPSCYLKTTNKMVKFQILKPFLFRISMCKDFFFFFFFYIYISKLVSLKAICYRTGKYTCTFHPGNCTGWSSEGVNRITPLSHSQ